MCVNEKETGVIAKVDDDSHQQTVHMRGKKKKKSVQAGWSRWR